MAHKHFMERSIPKRFLRLCAVAMAIVIVMLYLSSCQTMPEGAVPVKPFYIEKYMGKWYEIARFDFRFEKNLNNTTAEYVLNKNGTVSITNRGFNYKTKEWEQATGKAKFVSSRDEAKLKVSFFGPFYSGYNVLAIDPEYKYALVAGESLKYLWILSREKTIPDSIKHVYLRKAQQIGYLTANLIWVEHDK